MMRISILILLMFSFLVAEDVVLKIATVTPEGSLWTKKLRDIDRDIKRKTKGRVRLKIYADSRKGTEKEVAKKINDFKIDGALFLQSGLQEFTPQVNILTLPYFYRSSKHWNDAQAKLQKSFTSDLSKKNITVMGWLSSGFTYAFTNKPVNSLQEFKQLQNWLYSEEPLMKTCFERLQFKGKEIKVKEVLQSLQKKDINSVYASPYLLVALGWHKHVSHCVDLPINNVVGGFVMHENAYKSIPSKMRKKVARIIKKHMESLSKTIQKENEAARELLQKKYNVRFLKPDASWISTCQNVGQTIANENAGKVYTQQQLQIVK